MAGDFLFFHAYFGIFRRKCWAATKRKTTFGKCFRKWGGCIWMDLHGIRICSVVCMVQTSILLFLIMHSIYAQKYSISSFRSFFPQVLCIIDCGCCLKVGIKLWNCVTNTQCIFACSVCRMNTIKYNRNGQWASGISVIMIFKERIINRKRSIISSLCISPFKQNRDEMWMTNTGQNLLRNNFNIPTTIFVIGSYQNTATHIRRKPCAILFFSAPSDRLLKNNFSIIYATINYIKNHLRIVVASALHFQMDHIVCIFFNLIGLREELGLYSAIGDASHSSTEPAIGIDLIVHNLKILLQ